MPNGPLRLALATAIGAVAAACVLFALAPSHPARAANFDRYVAVGGRDDTDCSDASLPCLTPQYAINEASPGDVIKIAAGVYVSVTTHAFTTTGAYSFTQIAFISKTLTLSGGYTVTDNWAAANPAANPTVFNAGGAGRGVTVFGSGTEVVTVTGLTLTGGDYTGLGNPSGVSFRNCRGNSVDCGGGFYAARVRLYASHLTVTGNIASRTNLASYGGGLAIEETLDGTALEAITVTHNLVGSILTYGGGLALYATGSITVTDGWFQGNSAALGGGGISIVNPTGQIRVLDTTLQQNAALQAAAVYVEYQTDSTVELAQMQLISNATSAGDVIALEVYGAGLNRLALNNILIAGTSVTFTVPSRGLIRGEVGYAPDAKLLVDATHITAAANEGITLLEMQAVTTGVTSTLSSGVFTAALTNTIVSGLPALFLPVEMEPSHITITATRTLTEGVPAVSTGLVGTPAITLVETVAGQPRLGADYRPRAFSAAIDAARDVGTTVDASGAARDARPDIGALEAAPGTMTRVYVPSLLK